MSVKPDGYSNIVECPYNKAHQIENGRRFQTHLIKCRREYEKCRTLHKVQCPFNATHLINEPERQVSIYATVYSCTCQFLSISSIMWRIVQTGWLLTSSGCQLWILLKHYKGQTILKWYHKIHWLMKKIGITMLQLKLMIHRNIVKLTISSDNAMGCSPARGKHLENRNTCVWETFERLNNFNEPCSWKQA